MSKDQKLLACAARAANTTPEKFARKIRGILRRKGCRDTSPRRRVFTAEVVKAISFVK